MAYLGAAASVGVFHAFNTFALALWLSALTESLLLISLLANTRTFVGALVSPVAGAWSDRAWTPRLGRRRPFVLAGGLASAALLALTPAISRLPLPGALSDDLPRVAPAALAILLFTIAFNVMDDVHGALLADLVEGAARTRLSSVRVVVEMSGQVGILVLGFAVWAQRVPDWAFGAAGSLMAAGVLVTVLGVREPAPEAWQARRAADLAAAPRSARAAVQVIWREYRGAFVFCLAVLAYWFGLNAVTPLLAIYLRDILGASVGEAQLLPALVPLTTILLALPVGRLGNRFGNRRVLAAGYAVMVAAALAGLAITTLAQGALVFVLAGVGNAAVLVLTLPLLADLVARHHMGLANGLLAASGAIVAPLASVVAGALADVYGPRVIFALMAVVICAALAILPAVRPPRQAQLASA
jgi:MFS family permease